MPSKLTGALFDLEHGRGHLRSWISASRPDVWSFFDRSSEAQDLPVLCWLLLSTPTSEECVRILRHLSLASGASGSLHEQCLALAGRWLDDRSLPFEWTEIRSAVSLASRSSAEHWADQALVLGTLSAKFFKGDEWTWTALSALHVCENDRTKWRSLSHFFGSLPEVRTASYYKGGKKHASYRRISK